MPSVGAVLPVKVLPESLLISPLKVHPEGSEGVGLIDPVV